MAVELDGVNQKVILDSDSDTYLQASTDDTLDMYIAGAKDFVFTANKFEVQTGSVTDLNGTELILDANANTSITADTDDQIDIKIAGAETFETNWPIDADTKITAISTGGSAAAHGVVWGVHQN